MIVLLYSFIIRLYSFTFSSFGISAKFQLCLKENITPWSCWVAACCKCCIEISTVFRCDFILHESRGWNVNTSWSWVKIVARARVLQRCLQRFQMTIIAFWKEALLVPEGCGNFLNHQFLLKGWTKTIRTDTTYVQIIWRPIQDGN